MMLANSQHAAPPARRGKCQAACLHPRNAFQAMQWGREDESSRCSTSPSLPRLVMRAGSLLFGTGVLLFLALMLALSAPANAQAWGSINNFDTVNDTGSVCHGFEIEIDGAHSKDITYTYDWNHYGAPTITEDNSDPSNPKAFVLYKSAKNPDGSWAAYTAIPSSPINPTMGHEFTNPSVNFGGEHFGVGFYGTPTATKYSWLKDDGAGNLIFAGAVNIATPAFTPSQVAGVVQVQAVIVPPPPPAPPPLEFGLACWVKETKTQSHNNGKVEIRDLVSPDPNDSNFRNWTNSEPDEVEVEWQVMQTDFNASDGGVKGKVVGAPEDLPNGDEVVTRRYDFYKYVGPLDAETGEAVASVVGAADPDGVHYFGNETVTYNDHIDPITGEWVTVTVDLTTVWVVGDYTGAQMAGYDNAAKIGLVDHLQDGEINVAYPDRSMVIGGTAPITTTMTGSLPTGMSFDVVSGVLSGTPTATGTFSFSLHSTDSNNGDVTANYLLTIVPTGVQRPPHMQLTTVASPAAGGSTTGDAEYAIGDNVTATATANLGYAFANWTDGGAIVSTSPSYTFTADVNRKLIANFAPAQTYTIATSASPAAGGITSGDGIYNSGDSVTVLATANAGYGFVNWTEGGVVISTSASYTFTASASRSLVANFIVTHPTSIVLNPAKGQVGMKVTLSTILRDKVTKAYLVGKSVQFSLDGAGIGPPATTNTLGKATYTFIVPEEMSLGLHTTSATFAGDAGAAAATATSTLGVTKGPVKLTVAAVTGSAGRSVTLSARITDASNVPMVGEPLTFTVGGTAIGSAITDATGKATLPYVIPAGTAAGNYAIVVTFNEDADHFGATKVGWLRVK